MDTHEKSSDAKIARRSPIDNQFFRSIALWLFLGLIFLLIFSIFSRPSPLEGRNRSGIFRFS